MQKHGELKKEYADKKSWLELGPARNPREKRGQEGIVYLLTKAYDSTRAVESSEESSGKSAEL